jgi:hypothetical protein
VKGKLKGLLKEADLFGSPISLLHNGGDSKTSWLGGLGTLTIAVIFLAIFNNKITGFFRL